MRTMKSRMMLVAGSVAVMVAAGGCAGTSEGNAGGGGGPADSVAIDVGNDMSVNLPTGRALKVAYFLPSLVNDYGKQQVRGAEETAKELGVELTIFDGAFDPNRQLNQMQTALQSGGFDAALVSAVDGSTVCKAATEDFPKANILVVIVGSPLCGRATEQQGESLDELWAPGTMSYVGGQSSRAYMDGWFAAGAKANPGKQKVGVVAGLAVQEHTRVVEAAMAEFKKNNPDYTVDLINTNFSTADAFNKVQTYLHGNPDTTLFYSVLSPDVTQGVIQAVEDAGLQGQIHIVDQGFGDYLVEQLKAGRVQLSTLAFPYNLSKKSLESVVKAQSGEDVPRSVDDSVIGSVKEPFTATKDTLSKLPADLW